VTSNISSESVGGPFPDNRYLKDDQDWLLKNSTTMGLRLYLGASF